MTSFSQPFYRALLKLEGAALLGERCGNKTDCAKVRSDLVSVPQTSMLVEIYELKRIAAVLNSIQKKIHIVFFIFLVEMSLFCCFIFVRLQQMQNPKRNRYICQRAVVYR